MEGRAVRVQLPPFCHKIGLRALLAACCFLLQGCGPSDPLDKTVDADSPGSFEIWKAKAYDYLDADQMAEFEEAVREIKYEAMATSAATGSEAVNEAARQAVNGRTVRNVMERGLAWELSRLQAERWAQNSAASANFHARTKPGDTESASYLHDIVQRQEARVRDADAAINLVRRKLVALDPLWNDTQYLRPPAKPAVRQPAMPTPEPDDSAPQRIGFSTSKMKTPAIT
jgi:hypothetical protein